MSGGIQLPMQESVAHGVRGFSAGAFRSWQESAEYISQQPIDLRQRKRTPGIAAATLVVIRDSDGDGSSVIDGHDFRFKYTVQPAITLSASTDNLQFPTVNLPDEPDENTYAAWNLTEWINVTSSGTTTLGPGDVVGAGYYPTAVQGIVRAWWWDVLNSFVFFEANPMTSWAQEARLGVP